METAELSMDDLYSFQVSDSFISFLAFLSRHFPMVDFHKHT